MEALLSGSAEVNQQQVDGMTALHWAVQYNETNIARLLLEAGADANATNRTA